MREWNNLLADAGWVGIDWPVEHGGRGLGLAHQVVLAEELDRAGAPGTAQPDRPGQHRPVDHGLRHRRAEGPPPAARCCGATRSGARASASPTPAATWPRSPPAAVATATTGSISGQKVWNTYGQLADWCELLVRTDPARSQAPRASPCFLVDMTLPGIEVRPLRTATGDADFCELFFDDVRLPDSARLGPEGEGWTVAMATLSFERSGVANLHIPTRRRVARAHRRDPPGRPHRRPGRAPGARPPVDRGRDPAAAVGAGHRPGPAGSPARAGGQPDQAGVEQGEPGAAAGGHPGAGRRLPRRHPSRATPATTGPTTP